jgi:hypothetical protein
MGKRVAVAAFALIAALVLHAWAAKKGGETCEQNSDCETNTCTSGKCDPCPDRNNCPPPGTCTQSRHDTLAANKDTTCNQTRACTKVTDFNEEEASLPTLSSYLAINNACINARSEIMDECFKHGDDVHQRARSAVVTVRDDCESLIKTKGGKYLLYSCTQSDYDYYNRDIAAECRREDMTCSESSNDELIDCGAVEKRLAAAEKCAIKQDTAVSKCFEGRWNWRREKDKQAVGDAHRKCSELLLYKKAKSLCK